jgi:uncharacterized protein
VEPATAALLAAVGACAGLASTLFGIGGGIVMVPMLVYGLGLGFREATAVSLLAMAVPVPTGVWLHARRGAVDWGLAARMAVGGAAGVAAGAWLQPRLPVPTLKLMFAGLMLLAAFRMVRPLAPREGAPHPAYVVGAGAVAGVASKLFGIGGGLLTVPLLVLAGTPILAAVGSSLVPVFSNAALASAQALAAGLDWAPAVPLAIGAVATMPLGTRLAHRAGAPALKRAFAGLLAAAALYVAWTS